MASRRHDVSDLYDRLEEIQGMVRILTSDVELLKPNLGDLSGQAVLREAEAANRRSYVRAVFSLIEAVIEQHKRLLLDLVARRIVELEQGVGEALSERTYFVRDNGTVGEREQYLQFERKLRAVYRVAGDAFGQSLSVTFGDQGWQSFRTALAVRDRLTHPKTYDDCIVDENALDAVDRGHKWFRDLNN
jgi:hypothetical protein